MSDIASKGDYKAKKRDWDKKFPVKRGGGNAAVEEAAKKAAERAERRKAAMSRMVNIVAAMTFCARHGIPIYRLGMNTTRGASYTQFRRNTGGKHMLDRCGRARKQTDTSSEASFDEIHNYTQYGDVMSPQDHLDQFNAYEAEIQASAYDLGIDLSGTVYA